MNDKDYLDRVSAFASEMRRFHARTQQPERERRAVCGFLRCIGIDFAVDEIQSRPKENDPVDVEFRDAHFQVTDLLGERKPGRIWQERERKWGNADSVSDVAEPWDWSQPISYDEISREITKHLEHTKAAHFDAQTRATVDILVYVELLPKRHLWPLDPFSSHHNDLVQQGWRSVSMVSFPYGSVLAACGSAPEFLQSRSGQILKKWERIDGCFDLE